MGGFQVERTVVAGDTLIAEAIQSQNFSTGVSGWTINADGSYEFGPGGTIRSDVSVKGANGSEVDINADGSGAEIDFMPPNNADPTYDAFSGSILASTNGAGASSFDSLDLRSPSPFGGAGFGTTSLVSLQSGSPDGTSVHSFVLLQAAQIDVEGSLTVDGFPLPGTRVASAGITTTVNATNAEVVAITAIPDAGGTFTFQPGRLYKIVVTGNAFTSTVAAAANMPVLRFRKTNNAGQILDVYRVSTVFAGSTGAATASYTSYFKVLTTAVTANIVLTIAAPAAVTCSLSAAAGGPASMTIYDDGPATAAIQPWATTLV